MNALAILQSEVRLCRLTISRIAHELPDAAADLRIAVDLTEAGNALQLAEEGLHYLLPVAPATYLGWQEGLPGVVNGFELWNLTAPIGQYPAHSTLSRETIEALGYRMPNR